MGIAVEPEEASVQVGGTIRFRAYEVRADGTRGDEVTEECGWWSEYESVATVSDDAGTKGWATAAAELVGDSDYTIIHAERGDEEGRARLRVAPEVVGLKIHPEGTQWLSAGQEIPFTAEATFRNGEEIYTAGVSCLAAWASSTVSVAAVDGCGTVTGKAMGQSAITAEYEGQSDWVTVSVAQKVPKTLTVTPSSVELEPGEWVTFSATLLYADNVTRGEVTGASAWTSDDDAVVRPAPARGRFQAGEPGATRIRAKYQSALGQASGWATVTVRGDPERVRVEPSNPVAALSEGEVRFRAFAEFETAGGTVELEVTASPDCGWESSEPAVAAFGGQTAGLIGLKSVGRTEVWAAYRGSESGRQLLTVSAGPFIGEVGTIEEGANHLAGEVSLRKPEGYLRPVIVAQPISGRGSDPAVLRVRAKWNGEKNAFDAFEYLVQEAPGARDGGDHVRESFGYVVVEAGTYNFGGSLLRADSGEVEADRVVSFGAGNWEEVVFPSAQDGNYFRQPAVLSQLQGFEDHEDQTYYFAKTRESEVGVAGFKVGVERSENFGTEAYPEAAVAVGYLAIESNRDEPKEERHWAEGYYYECGLAASGSGGDLSRVTLQFAAGLFGPDAPAVIGAVASYADGDHCGLRYLDVSGARPEQGLPGGFRMWLEEDRSVDPEQEREASEVVSYLALGGRGLLVGRPAQDGEFPPGYVPTATPTPSPSVTPTPSPSPSPTKTPTPSPSTTPSPSPSKTPSPSPSPSPTPSPSASPSPCGGDKPLPPRLLAAYRRGDDVVIDWEDVVEDVQGNPVTVSAYRVYRGTEPGFAPRESDVVSSPPESVFADLGALRSPDNYFYYVTAVAGDHESSFSEMAVKYRNRWEYRSDISNLHWMALPYWTAYTYASDLGNAIGAGRPCTQISRWSDQTQQYESLGWIGTGWVGQNFKIRRGEAYLVSTNETADFPIVGFHDSRHAFNWQTNPGRSNIHWFSPPYQEDYRTLTDLGDDIGGGDFCTQVSLWSDQTQQYESIGWVVDTWVGKKHSEVPPGKGCLIIIKRNISGFVPRILSPVSQ